MTTAKVAWRLAFSPDVRQRWRQVSVVLGALLATLLACSAAGLIHAAHDSDRRIAARSPLWATTDSAAVLKMSARGITLTGFGQFPVVWLEPTPGNETNPAAVPPGLKRLPGPGEAVLSEGLVAAGYRAADFGLKESPAGTGANSAIGREGLSTLSEGWIYARPARGRSLGSGGALLMSAGYPGSASQGINFETIPEVPSAPESLLGAAWMLLAPAAFLLFGAVRAMSQIRDQRAQTLWRLGVASWRIRLLLGLETTFLSLMGALPAAVIWLAWLGRTPTVPLTVARLQPNALTLEPAQLLALVGGVAVAAGASACVGRIRNRTLTGDARVVRPWHAAPLLVAFLMMAAGPWLPPDSGLRLYLLFGGLLLTFTALPMGLPVLVARLGEQLGCSTRPAIWLAGRRLSLRSANLAKPAAMVGALVFVAGAAFALYDRLVAPEENRGSAAPFAAYHVDWRDPIDGDAQRALRMGTPKFAVLPLTGADTGAPQVHFSDCAQIETTISSGSAPCQDGHLTETFKSTFTQLTGASPVLGGGAEAQALYVIGPKDSTAREVMGMLAGALPAVNIDELGGASKSRDPRAGWMLAGWTLATLILALALIREIGDRALSSMHDLSHLLRVGLRREEVESSYRWSLLPPVAVAIPVGFLGAVVFALFGYQLGVTIGNLGRIAAVAAASAVLAALVFLVVLRLQHRLINTDV